MIGFIVAILLFAIILFTLISLTNKKAPELDKDAFRKSWVSILEKAKNPHTQELAIINGDKLLDLALKKSGFKGETMGERLISAKNKLTNRNAVWEAHKLRNRLVHEENVHLDRQKIERTLKGFEVALKDLGAI